MPGPNANSKRTRAAIGPGAESALRLALFAAQCATNVGRWLVQERRQRATLGARNKAVGDPVTDLDIAGEERLRAMILRTWPRHGFIGEETGASHAERSHVWIVDPIDGTANFALGLQPWGVSVACLRDGDPIAGAVYAHPEDVTVVAARGKGVSIGGQRIRLRPQKPLGQKLLGQKLLGQELLGPDSVVAVQWLRGTRRISFVNKLLSTGTRIRVFGCTVVQLCDVARGRLHANVQQQGRVWDVAASGLIVREAGGCFMGWDGRAIFPCSEADLPRHHPSIAASPAVHRQILDLLGRPHSIG